MAEEQFDDRRTRLRALKRATVLSWCWFAFGIVVVAVLWHWLGHYPLGVAISDLKNPNEAYPRAGTYGDSFGMVNSLFSALAFAAIVFTLYQQQLELRYQHQEIADSLEQHQESADSQRQLEKT